MGKRGLLFYFFNGDAQALAPGETLRFSYTHNGIMERLVMGPRGVFLVQDREAQDAEVAIKWKDAKGLPIFNCRRQWIATTSWRVFLC